MEEKVVECFAAFTASVIFIGIGGFMLELVGSLISVWKKILSK